LAAQTRPEKETDLHASEALPGDAYDTSVSGAPPPAGATISTTYDVGGVSVAMITETLSVRWLSSAWAPLASTVRTPTGGSGTGFSLGASGQGGERGEGSEGMGGGSRGRGEGGAAGGFGGSGGWWQSKRMPATHLPLSASCSSPRSFHMHRRYPSSPLPSLPSWSIVPLPALSVFIKYISHMARPPLSMCEHHSERSDLRSRIEWNQLHSARTVFDVGTFSCANS